MDITRTFPAERPTANPAGARQLVEPIPAVAPPVVAAAAAVAPVASAATDNSQIKSAADKKAAEPSAAEIAHSVEAINKFLKPVASNIQFSVDQDSGTTLVKIIDTETQVILRQIPSKEALSMAKELDKLQGLLVREKA